MRDCRRARPIAGCALAAACVRSLRRRPRLPREPSQGRSERRRRERLRPARLLTSEESRAQVRVANNILIITFQRPVDVTVDRINATAARLYQRGAARSRRQGGAHRARAQGDGQLHGGGRAAVRRSAARHLDRAAARPAAGGDRGTRAPRARGREEGAAAAHRSPAQNKMAPIRVRVVEQPTFTRYMFELPELIGVSADNSKDKLTLTFERCSVRSRRCQGDAAAGRSRRSTASSTRTRRSCASASRQGRRPHLPRGQQLRRRCERGRGQGRAAGRSVRSDELSTLAAELSARKDGAAGGRSRRRPCRRDPARATARRGEASACLRRPSCSEAMTPAAAERCCPASTRRHRPATAPVADA